MENRIMRSSYVATIDENQIDVCKLSHDAHNIFFYKSRSEKVLKQQDKVSEFQFQISVTSLFFPLIRHAGASEGQHHADGLPGFYRCHAVPSL